MFRKWLLLCQKKAAWAKSGLARAGPYLIVLLTLYALLVIVFDAGRPFVTAKSNAHWPWSWYPIATLNFQTDNNGKVIEVDPTVEQTEDIRVNDVIDLHSIKPDRRAINKFLFVAHGSSFTFRLKNRPESLRVEAQDETFHTADTIALLTAQASGVIFIGLCAFLVWRSPSWQTWGLFLYSLWFNSGQYFFWYANLPMRDLTIFDIVQVFLQAVGLTGFLAFALHFPSHVEGWRRTARPYLLGVTFVLLLVFNLLGYTNFIPGWRSEDFFLTYYYLTFAVYAIVASLFVDIYLHRPSLRPKILWIALGGIWGLGWWLLADIYETTNMLRGVVAFLQSSPWLTSHWGDKGMTTQATLNLMYAMNLTLPLAVLYTALHHRVMGLRFPIVRAIVILFPLILTIEAFEFGVDLFGRRMRFSWFAESAAGLLAVGLTAWRHDWLHHQVERICCRRWCHERECLEDMSKQLLDDDDLDLSKVDGRLVQDIGEALRLKSAALFHRRDEDGSFVRQEIFRWPARYLQSLPADHPFKTRDGKGVKLTSLTAKPVRLRDPDADDDSPPKMEEYIPAPILAAPIVIERHVSRLLLFDRDEDFDPDEIGVLSAVTLAAAHAYRVLDLKSVIGQRRNVIGPAESD